MKSFDINQPEYFGFIETKQKEKIHAFNDGIFIYLVYNLSEVNERHTKKEISAIEESIDDYLWTPYIYFLKDNRRNNKCLPINQETYSLSSKE